MKEECIICKAPLIYLEKDEMMECVLCHKKEFRWIQLDGGKYRISKKSFDDWLDNLEQ